PATAGGDGVGSAWGEAAGGLSVTGAATALVCVVGGVGDAGTSRSSSSGPGGAGGFCPLAVAGHNSNPRASGRKSQLTLNKGGSADEGASFRPGAHGQRLPRSRQVLVRRRGGH